MSRDQEVSHFIELDQTESVPQARTAIRPSKAFGTIRINLGSLINKASEEVEMLPEDLFGRHCAVLGTTGGGKSWTLAKIIEESCNFNSKIILFDASGEFDSLNDGVEHVAVGTPSSPKEKAVAVPYYHLRESDLFAIFKPGGPSQGPKFRAAIQSLKLALLAPNLTADGTIVKAHRSKLDFDKERLKHNAKIESPYNEFTIKHLPQQIQNECVEPQRSPAEPHTWGAPNSIDLSYCIPLVNRIQDMIHSPNLSAIFRPKGMPSLFEEISKFLKDDTMRVLRVSLKNLPFEHNTREIVGNAVGRHLLELARRQKFIENPLVVILDEAHQFLSKTLREQNDNLPLDAFGLIAKEGRKYALNIIISTQRPRDIPEDVLSQVGMFLVHRLTNDHDLNVIERASGSVNRQTMSNIPALLPGQAVLVGVSVSEPKYIKISPPVNKPDSRGPNFQKFWG